MQSKSSEADTRSGHAMLSYLSSEPYLDLFNLCILLCLVVEPMFCFVVQLVCNMSAVSHIDYIVELYYCFKD